jgi:hypothetical protein
MSRPKAKRCPRCGQVKPADQFYVPGGQEGGSPGGLCPRSGCSRGPSAPIMRHSRRKETS